MGRSHDLATGVSYQDQTETDARYHTKTASDAAFAAKSGDTFTGAVNVNGGNLTLNSTNDAAHRYLYLNASATNDGHILFQRAGSPRFQISSDTSHNLFTWNYARNGTSHRINTDGSVITPHQPGFSVAGAFGWRDYGSSLTEVVNWYSTQTGFYNTGMFNNSTGRATAPQAGKYLFNVNMYVNGNGDTQHAGRLYINGSSFGDSYMLYQNSDSGYPDNTLSASFLISLSANDYVSWWSTYDVYGYHSSFSGHFLG